MSVTTHLVCTKCKVYMWLGQGDIIYTGEEKTMQNLTEFLKKHKSYYDTKHELLFMDEPFNGPFESEDWESED